MTTSLRSSGVSSSSWIPRSHRPGMAVWRSRSCALQPFDLVLLDVQMPEMDGVAVLDQMKSDMSLREVPVIMVSAVDDFETVLRCIAWRGRLRAEAINADLLRARSRPRSSAKGCVIRRAFLSSSSGKRRPA